jgi:hypothetical protein
MNLLHRIFQGTGAQAGEMTDDQFVDRAAKQAEQEKTRNNPIAASITSEPNILFSCQFVFCQLQRNFRDYVRQSATSQWKQGRSRGMAIDSP